METDPQALLASYSGMGQHGESFADFIMSTHTLWKKILVPTDFSEDSLTALREALRFHQLCQTEVVLLHVTDPGFEGLRIQTSDRHEKSQAGARHELEALATAYFSSGESVMTLIKKGRAADVICETALEYQVDAIFIATHGITALKHLMLGSVVENVLRQAPCSVLVVR
jgi:nucleotide-binding universal stress UspA family protein